MSSIQAIVLDVGGVLVRLNFTTMVTALGLSPESTSHATMYRFDSLPNYDRFERGLSNIDEFREWITQTTGTSLSPEQFLMAWNSVFEGPVPGVTELLSKVKLPLYGLSNSTLPHIEHLRKTTSIFGSMKKLFTSYEMGVRKPEPEAYLRVSQAIGLEPQSILFVDDREENIQGARNVGMIAEPCLDSADALRAIFLKHCPHALA